MAPGHTAGSCDGVLAADRGVGFRALIMASEMLSGVAPSETIWGFLKKLHLKPPCDPALPFPGLHLREVTADTHLDTHMNVLSSESHVARRPPAEVVSVYVEHRLPETE